MQVMTDEKKVFETVDRNLFDFIRSGAGYSDEDTVFTYFGRNFTFGYFRKNVDKISRILLADEKLRSGDRIVISLLTMPESICLLYACNYIGLVPVMVDIRLSPGEMKRVITEMDAQYAFVTDVNSKRLSVMCEAACLRKLFVVPMAQSLGAPAMFFRKFSSFFTGNPYMFTSLALPKAFMWKDFVNAPGIPEDRALTPSGGDSEMIFATSGTTGEKKYVRHLARSLNMNVYFNEFLFDLRSSEYELMIAFMPIFVCFGFAGSIHLPLYYGMRIHIHMIYDLRKIPDIIMKVKPNYFVGSLGHWERIADSPKVREGDLSFLRFALFSGERCESEKQKRINDILLSRGSKTKLLQAYGMTELTVISVQQQDDDMDGNLGRPFPFINISITDPETGEIKQCGQVGEICVDSPCRTIGYSGNEEETARLLRRHDDGKIWVHTGDLGYIDERGYLYFVDRIKNMLVSVSGTKIYLPTIDRAVEECENVAECAAVAIKDADIKVIRSIVLFVVPKPGFKDRDVKKSVKSLILRELPRYLIPDRIEIIREMPALSSGKIDRAKLESMAEGLIINSSIPLVSVK